MNKPLIFTAVLMSAALVAGAAVDADNIYHRFFPEVKIVEYRDVGNLQPGMLIVVKVEEARNG